MGGSEVTLTLRVKGVEDKGFHANTDIIGSSTTQLSLRSEEGEEGRMLKFAVT